MELESRIFNHTTMSLEKENIIINVVLGVVALITLIMLIFLVWYRFYKSPRIITIQQEHCVVRIPNPIYNSSISETTV